MGSIVRTGDAQAAGSDDRIEAARRGDPDALEAIARSELVRVERLLLKLLGPRADLEDLVQNVFVELFRALPRFRGDSQMSTFVGGITVHVARRAMRPSAWVRRRVDVEVDPVATDSSAEQRADAKHGLARVHAALEHIAPKKRIAFLLWALDGQTPEQIATLTNTSLSATRSRIYYAQKELRARAERDPILRDLIGDLS